MSLISIPYHVTQSHVVVSRKWWIVLLSHVVWRWTETSVFETLNIPEWGAYDDLNLQLNSLFATQPRRSSAKLKTWIRGSDRPADRWPFCCGWNGFDFVFSFSSSCRTPAVDFPPAIRMGLLIKLADIEWVAVTFRWHVRSAEPCRFWKI